MGKYGVGSDTLSVYQPLSEQAATSVIHARATKFAQTSNPFAIDKLATLGKAAGDTAAWAYNFIQKPKAIYDAGTSILDEVNAMQDDYLNWKEDDDLSDYADDLLAINMMLKILEHDDIMGKAVPSKNLMYGAQQYFKAISSTGRALSSIDGSTVLTVTVNDDCWLHACGSGAGVKVLLKMQPISVCESSKAAQDPGAPDFAFNTCIKFARDSATVIANTVTAKGSVWINTSYNSKVTIEGLGIGWYLLEARRTDNNNVVHRQTVFVDRANDEEEITITDQALKNTAK